jgi:hypothetical protein
MTFKLVVEGQRLKPGCSECEVPAAFEEAETKMQRAMRELEDKFSSVINLACKIESERRVGSAAICAIETSLETCITGLVETDGLIEGYYWAAASCVANKRWKRSILEENEEPRDNDGTL